MADQEERPPVIRSRSLAPSLAVRRPRPVLRTECRGKAADSRQPIPRMIRDDLVDGAGSLVGCVKPAL